MRAYLLLALLAPLSINVASPDTPTTDLGAAIEDDYENNLGALFEHFHRNPELSFREFETAKRLADELAQLGVDVTTGVGGTGVVGMLRNGKGPLVLIRADMDGLPVKELTNLPYASRATQENINGEIVPVMHACGHDVHMTSLIGTARQLSNRRSDWQGTIMFIGQPAEERIGGARAMLEDGLYEKFGVPDYALAFHVSSGQEAGKIHVPKALAYSSSDSVDITVRGVGAHGAAPHTGKDPVYLAAQLVVALQGIISREVSPLSPGVITVGSIHGGFKHNIIPEAVKLELTVRSNDEQTRAQLLAAIERIARGVAITAGLPENLYPIVDLSVESTPTTINNPELAARVEAAIVAEMGEAALFQSKQEGMGAEDFAYFVQTEHKVPGAYFAVGGSDPELVKKAKAGEIKLPSHHSPIFQITPEPSIIAGTRAMTAAALKLLEKPK